MRLRNLLVPLVVSGLAVGAVQAAASADYGRNDQQEQHGWERHDGKHHDSSPLTEQNFTITSDFSEEGGGPVVASGAINATGQDVVISDTEDNFIFPGGTLTVFHAPVRSKQSFDEETCTGSFRESGRYVISSATGQYAGDTGSGEYRASGSFVNGCEGQTPTGTVNITAEGSINLPTP